METVASQAKEVEKLRSREEEYAAREAGHVGHGDGTWSDWSGFRSFLTFLQFSPPGTQDRGDYPAKSQSPWTGGGQLTKA